MSAQFLANAAIRQAHKHTGTLHVFVVEKLALAHVAQWLYDQDCPSDSTAKTAYAAIGIIKRHFI